MYRVKRNKFLWEGAVFLVFFAMFATIVFEANNVHDHFEQVRV